MKHKQPERSSNRIIKDIKRKTRRNYGLVRLKHEFG
jgi:hypothetical protein